MRKRNFVKMKFQNMLEHSTATLLILLYLQGVLSQVSAQSESPLTIDVSDGEDATLECRFSPQLSKADSTLFWIRTNRKGHDNVAIGNTPYQTGYRVEHFPDQGRYDLIISKATYDRDNGQFECRMKEGGSGDVLHSKSVELTVLLQPSEPKISPSDATATEGRPLNLTCASIGGSPPPQIYWYRDGDSKKLEANLIPGKNKDEPTRSVLTIIPTKEQDSSLYRCTVWNRALGNHQKLEADTKIFVNYFPRVRVGPENPLKVEKDDTARLECLVDAKPTVREVKWTRMLDGRFIATTFNHTIPRVTLQDSGNYMCSARNGLGQPGKEELKLDVLFAPVVTLAERREANENEDVEINCQVSSNPRPATIQWFREGDDKMLQNGPALRLSNVKAKHNGRYTCSASNFLKPSGKEGVMRAGNATIEISVRHKPGKTTITPSKPVAVDGEKITLKCGSNPPGYPAPQFKWWKEGGVTNLAVGSEFTIESARLNNAGRYYCQPANDLGRGTEASIDIDVHQAPKITTPLQPTIIKREGDSGFQITCSAKGKPKPKIRWFKDDEEIFDSESNMFQISTSEQQTIEHKAYNVLSTLKFAGFDRIKQTNLVHTDKGHYTCQFENDVSKAVSTMSLVIEHGPVVVHQHNKVAFDPGTTAYISCQMKAYPMPQFDWSYGNSLLNDHNLFKQTRHRIANDVYEGILQINTVTESNYGEYTCKAKNKISDKRTRIKLQRKGKPEKPSAVRAMQTNYNSILVGWDNGFNGGYNNTKYTIQYKKHYSSQPSYKECLQRNPCNLTGLDQHSQYYISVKANNNKGESKYSKEATILTKVDVKKIPKPEDVHFETKSNRASFHIKNKFLPLIAQIELMNKESGNTWQPYTKLPLGDVSMGEVKVNNTRVRNLRVRLCLETNDVLCGNYAKARLVDKLPTKSALGLPWVIVVVILVALGGVIGCLIAIKCCCCKSQTARNKKDVGKDRPTIIHSTQPPYGHGIENKGVDTLKDADEILKNNLYSAQQNGYEQQSTSNTNSANGGSVNSQDSLWNVKGHENNAAMMIQHNQNGYPMHPQQQMQQQQMQQYVQQGYDPMAAMQQYQQQQQPQQQQGYPDEYAHYPYPDEYLNERNQQFLANNGLDPYGRPIQRSESDYSPYGDVNGIPDPYNGAQMEDPQSQQHFYNNGHGQQMSFEDVMDGSGQNGYITPNAKSKRIVREIIV